MLALLQAPTNHMPGWLQVAVAVLAGLQSAAIVLGIAAAYYRFVREKPHTSRLQPAISGAAAIRGGVVYLQINLSAENVGQVPVSIDTAATGLRLSSRFAGQDAWTVLEVVGALDQQEQVQPGATVIDRLWREFPHEGQVAFRLELSVTEEVEDEDSGWLTVEVVNLVARGDNVGDGEDEG